MKRINVSLLLALLIAGACSSISGQQGEMPPAKVEGVYFYGHGGLDLRKLARALPVRVGDRFRSPIELVESRPRMEQAVKRATGRAATDVSYVSPGGDKWLVYVGVAGKSVKPFRYNPVPRGDPKLPEEAVRIYRETHEAFMNAIRRGATGEDDSRGFALSKEDEELRTKQLAMHEYAKRNEKAITAVLRGSGNAEQRAMAAELLGYTDRSPRQIAELVRAARDADDGVRNNATRALIVLARSDAKTAAMIPATDFVDMLNSGEWTDRNKAGGLLAELTRKRDRRVLAALKSRALVSLIDMARWATDHAESARWMLGRIAGIQEERLEQMVGEDSKVEMLIRAARRRK